MGLDELKSQYETFTLDELKNLRENAVLSRDAEEVLTKVIAEKIERGSEADYALKETKESQLREKMIRS